jgi:hypothetical protein
MEQGESVNKTNQQGRFLLRFDSTISVGSVILSLTRTLAPTHAHTFHR